MWKRIFIILVIASASSGVYAQHLSPRERGILNFYYAQRGTNEIDGEWIILGTISTNKLTDETIQMLIDGTNAWDWVNANSQAVEIVVDWVEFNSNNIPTGFVASVGTSNAVTYVPNVVTIHFESNYTEYIELAYTNSQTFTAAAGFELLTNQYVTCSNGSFIATDSNITVGVDSVYKVSFSGSLESSINNVITEGHLFTNGVEHPVIGWTRKTGTGTDQGSFAGSGFIKLNAGDVLAYYLDVDKNTDLSFDHSSFMVEQKK